MNFLTDLKRRRWLTAYAPLIVWIVVVLGLGSGLGSMNETSRIIRPLLEFIFPAASPETLTVYHGYIRKFAHFAEYAVLGLLAARAFRPLKRPHIGALALVAATAAVDEVRQTFDATRTGSGYDVLIDLAGGLFGILLYKIASAKFARRR